MKIACVTYRDWAIKIYKKLQKNYLDHHEFYMVFSKDEFDEMKLKKFQPDLILWYGWSWIVSKQIINKYVNLMLHPSPLPKYRGGSPIQNQIIRGEKISAVSIFKMTNELDNGDIYFQKQISLEGSLIEIFNRIINVGFLGSTKILEGNFKIIKQNEKDATYYSRRKPSDSEITIHEIKTKSSKYLYDKIRMLNDPYPNAYIITSDNKKLFITNAKIE